MTEIPATLDAQVRPDRKVQLDGFVMQSVLAFARSFDQITQRVTAEVRKEAEAFGVDPGHGGLITKVFFVRKFVPNGESVSRMKELLYSELSEDEIRAIHDGPNTQDKFDVESTVPWDDEHIRLFRFRDGECVERAAT